MQTLRIHGVVRLADRVRRELSRPITKARKEALCQTVSSALKQVDEILANHSTQINTLPAPTRRAHEFLKSLDFNAISNAAADTATDTTLGSVRFNGLQRDLERRIEILGTASAEVRESIFKWVARVHEDIEKQIAKVGIAAEQLTPDTRDVRSWLGCFSRRGNFDAYLAALDRGRPILEKAMRPSAKYKLPVILQFRVIKGLYRVRGFDDGTRVVLPAPMICFSDELFTELAQHLVEGGGRQRLHKATASEEYRAIQAELEVLGGVEEHSEGVHHDLAQSFDRVNRAYFDGRMARPRLTWSRSFTRRKFGHYDSIRDVVMISSTLDKRDMPEFVIDYLMYHELLHKHLGAEWQDGRRAVHTPEFRRLEQRYCRFADAEAILDCIASS